MGSTDSSAAAVGMVAAAVGSEVADTVLGEVAYTGAVASVYCRLEVGVEVVFVGMAGVMKTWRAAGSLAEGSVGSVAFVRPFVFVGMQRQQTSSVTRLCSTSLWPQSW